VANNVAVLMKIVRCVSCADFELLSPFKNNSILRFTVLRQNISHGVFKQLK